MMLDGGKMRLTAEAMAGARKAHAAAVEAFLDPAALRANVVGLGVGVKWRGGQPTGDPALVVLVTHKVEKGQLRAADLVPSQLEGMATDVLAVGFPVAGDEPGTAAAGLARRMRPVRGGYSVGHAAITAGTLGACVYDILPEGGSSPPRHGVGIPPRYYILSNNHVLANGNSASPGDPILQPGPWDGGKDPEDRIARLSRFVPITFDPPVPRSQHRNLVDAAIAEADFHDLDREVYWLGRVRGWAPRASVPVGTVVAKTGRTTGFTTGRVTVVEATLDVGYGSGKLARFQEQIVTTPMSAGGDSGSLVCTVDGVAVGLLFAGSPSATILNPIEAVRALLRVEVAEQILAPSVEDPPAPSLRARGRGQRGEGRSRA